MNERFVNVIGAGLAGSEAALTLAARGIRVRLFECKPKEYSPAHRSPDFGELVCSNSLKSTLPTTASGLLKEELRILGSRLLAIAERCAVPAGSALAVDRAAFARGVTESIRAADNIEVITKTADDWREDEYTIIATGPLTLPPLAETLSERLGKTLHFYDAAAPIVDGASLDMSAAFTADRYGRGEGDYVNCPMNKEEYEAFWNALVSAECAILRDFEKNDVFEGCMPVEIMAKRGRDALRFGPLRPVGFGSIGNRPYAVVQLRRENTAGDAFNIVGFQTNLRFGEQERVFRMIPALKNAEFLRYGVMHRNTFINAPECIDRHFRTLANPKTFIAGQLSGVEGYVESIASGLIAALGAAAALDGKEPPDFPPTTVVGALTGYLATPNANFQPMNANFGLLPPIEGARVKGRDKKAVLYERSIKDLKNAGF